MGMDQMLVGRGAECAALRGALPGARAGAGSVILVTGEGGAGKTTLVEHVLASTGAPVLRGRAVEWAGTAYDVLARALRPAAATATAPVPVLAQILPELGPPPAEPAPAALAAAVASVLAGIAGADHPVLFLDDLQWADEATLGLLPALAEAVTGRQATLIGCYRSDELPRDHRLRAVRAQLRRTGQLTEIEVGPLADDDVARMLGGLLGATPQPPLVAVVARRADGLPFAVEELAFALRDGGRLAYQDRAVTLAGAGAAPVPDGIREAVLLRAARLTDQERTLLEAAAVAGSEFDVDTVLAACELASWPDAFTGAGLLTEVRDGRAAFRHSLTQEAAYADIPWSRRRRLHRALAAALAADGASQARIAVHLEAARDFAAARQALIAAADEHCAVHAYRDGVRALRAALEYWPSGPEDQDRVDEDRLAVIARLARCAEMCSEYADAVALLRELIDGYEQHGDLAAVATTRRRLALAHELRGQWESALTAREAAAMAFVAAGQPAEAAVDRLAVASHLRAAASYSAALATLSAARADAEACGRADLLLRTEGMRGNVLSRLGKSREGIAAVRSALDQALAGTLSDTAAELQQRLADALEHSGDYRAAAAAYGAAYQFCDAHGADAMGQLCRACATAVLFTRGEWDRTAAVCADVLASATVPHALTVAGGLLGLVNAMRGETRLARPQLLESQLAATRIELTAMELLAAWGLCVVDQAEGADDQAADRARQILARLARTQERHYSVQILQWLATYFAEQGLAGDVRACGAALAEIAAATAQPEAVAALAHARAETLLATEPGTAARELRLAAGMFDELGLPLASAQAQRRAATGAVRAGDPSGARELLGAAFETASRLGARQLREACRSALTELGATPRPKGPARRAAAGLTGRELEIMQLVAQGNTSRQIGEALFISPRTVEMHVQGSLLKLQCRTRADAVRRLAELGTLERPRQAGPRGARS